MELIYIANLNSIHTVRWVNFFANLNKYQITCISLKSRNKETNNNVKVLLLKNYFDILNLIKSILILGSKKKSIIHVHYLGWHSLLLFFANKNKTIILTPWGCDIYHNKKNLLKKFFLILLFKKCDYIICDSSKLIKAASELGASKIRSEIIAFGTDIKKYKSTRKAFSNIVESNFINIGTNRYMEEIYDPITLLKAANILSKKNNNYKFIIANNGSLKKELQAYVFKNNLQNIVNFIGPQYGKDNIEFYNSIDIYVSTSLRDGGLAASVAEAMSCERLVIVSDNSENSKYIKNGYSGYLFENKNYLILAELIEKSYIEHHKSKSIAEKGREVILNSCNYYLEMTKVDHIYNKLIKNKA